PVEARPHQPPPIPSAPVQPAPEAERLETQPEVRPQPPKPTRVELPTPTTPPVKPAGARPETKEQAPAAAQPTPPSQPQKPEPVKYGPTGRVIELPLPRIEIRQADPRDRFATRDARGQLPQRREQPGQRDRFQQQKKKAQPGKKQKQTLIT